MAKSHPQFWKEIRAQGFVVSDDAGKPKISLDAKYGLRFFGQDSRPKASLGLNLDGNPFLVFFHGSVPRVNLHLDEKGNPDFNLVGNKPLQVAEIVMRAFDREDAEKARAAKQKPSRRKTTKRGA